MSKKPKKEKKKLTKKQLRRRKRRRLFIAEIVVLIILVVGLCFWLFYQKDSKKTEDMLKGDTCIALFGVDNRSAGNFEDGRSDTIIVACINNDTKEVKLCSVYRDSYLDVCSDDDSITLKKCNAAYGSGGAEQAIEMLNKNLDLSGDNEIKDYVAVDFNALVDVIDAVGGIEVDVQSDEIYYLNAYAAETAKIAGKSCTKVTHSGTQTLDGVQATGYCRIRYTSGDDFKRTSRQREVLSKTAEKAKALSTTQKLSLASSIIDEIDTSLTLNQINGLIKVMSDYTLADTSAFPFYKTTGTYGSAGSVVVPCTLESNVIELHKYFFDDEDYEPSSTLQEISDAIQKKTGKSASDAQEYKTYDY